jgi:hypothetical protein
MNEFPGQPAESDVPQTDILPSHWLERRVSPAEISTDIYVLPWIESLLRLAREGDEFWAFSSPPETWEDSRGSAGFVLIRDGKQVAHVDTTTNEPPPYRPLGRDPLQTEVIPSHWLERPLSPAEVSTDNLQLWLAPLLPLVREDDEFWAFCSPPASWQDLCGRAGFVLIHRDGQQVGHVVTMIN